MGNCLEVTEYFAEVCVHLEGGGEVGGRGGMRNKQFIEEHC